MRWARTVLLAAGVGAACGNGVIGVGNIGADHRADAHDAAAPESGTESPDAAVADAEHGDAIARPDATRTDDASTGSGDASGAPDASVEEGAPAFVLQGHMGRTAVSCDDGRTWIGERAFDVDGHALACGETQAVRCWNTDCNFVDNDSCRTESPCDCDHHPGAARGLTFGSGWFVATFGWGPPGAVFRSRDGFTWEMVHQGSTFGGVGFDGDRFLLGARSPLESVDGQTWSPGPSADFRSGGQTIWNVRFVSGFEDGPVRQLMVGSDGGARDMLLRDDGEWWRPSVVPGACLDQVRGAARSDDGVLVLVTRDGTMCRSADGGSQWSSTSLGATIESGVQWDGQSFVAYSRGVRHLSADGASWTPAATSPDDFQPARIARNPETGTYVAIQQGWQSWYDEQRAWRSSDGVSWTPLGADAFRGGHPVFQVAFGYSTACP